jgi:hypothetical protein
MAKSRAALTADLVQRALDETRTSLPIVSLVQELFTDPKMFRSFGRFQDAGFSLVDHPPYKCMVGRHKRARGYLFKKFSDERAADEQLSNYMHRVEGAALIRSFIEERGFSRVTVPRKWLYELPTAFPARYLVIVEALDIRPRLESQLSYASIGKTQMHELATVLYYFRGLSSTASNLPFTKDGQIAFIDTERWHHDKDFLRKIEVFLSPDRRKQAKEIYKELRRQGARALESSFA